MSKHKGNEDMVRIIAIAAAFLVMCIIIGISVHSINRIDQSNQEIKDVEAGKQFAASIMNTEATTNIWDYLRNTTAPVTQTTESESLASSETVLETDGTQGEESFTTENTITETQQEQTTAAVTQTSSTGFILQLD